MTRLTELEALNREYAERAQRAEEEIARMRQNVSQFGTLLWQLKDHCMARYGTTPAQHFRHDPALGGSSTLSWAAWLEVDDAAKAYGRSGEDALRALVALVKPR